jgi:hypothetical protein
MAEMAFNHLPPTPAIGLSPRTIADLRESRRVRHSAALAESRIRPRGRGHIRLSSALANQIRRTRSIQTIHQVYRVERPSAVSRGRSELKEIS